MSTEVRALPYPVLKEGNLSWPQGSYEASVEVRSDRVSATVSHNLSEVPFLEQALRDGHAQYACAVSIPITNYRKLHLTGEANQVVTWESDFCGEAPRLLPMVIAVQEMRHVFGPEDGISRVWQGRELTIPKGARLAQEEYWGDDSSMENLIEVLLDENLSPGSFKVVDSSELGYYFKVHAAKDLHRFLQDRRGQSNHRNTIFDHRNSILTHIASRCLEILATNYGGDKKDEDEEGGWRTYQNLRGLAALLEQREQRLWDEDGFNADEVATVLYPHKPPQESEGGGGGGQ